MNSAQKLYLISDIGDLKVSFCLNKVSHSPNKRLFWSTQL